MKKILTIFLLSVLVAFSDNPRGDDNDGDKLDQIEKDAAEGGEEIEGLAEAILFLMIHFPELFIGMGQVLFGSSTEEGDYGYSEYPYYYAEDGLYSESSTFTRAGNINLSYLYESINYSGLELEVTLFPTKSISFDIAAKNYISNAGLETNELRVIDFYINWQRARFNNFDFRWGLGIKALDGDVTNMGFGYNLAFDIYGMDPVSINFQYTGAFINSSYYNDLNIDLNYHQRNLVFFVGFDYFASQSASILALKVGTGVNF